MTDIPEANIEENKQPDLFKPHIQKIRKVLFGYEKPGFYVQFVFIIGAVVSTIFGIWNIISWMILSFPTLLKTHKQVDVEAIVGLRARELGFDESTFYSNLEWYHLIGIILWIGVGVFLLFFWRQKKWAIHSIVFILIVQIVLTLFLLGPNYFLEDTTLFDKLSHLAFLLLMVVANFVVKSPQQEILLEE